MLSTWVLATLLGFNRGYQQGLNRDIDNMGFQVLLTAKHTHHYSPSIH